MERFRIKYKGNYILESDDWGDVSSPNKEQFVTYLYYTLQMACVALYYNHLPLVIGSWGLVEVEYLVPVLEKRDVYLCCSEFDWYGIDLLEEILESGIEIRVNGISSADKSMKEMKDILRKLENEKLYLTRELDAKVFENSGIKEFKAEKKQ